MLQNCGVHSDMQEMSAPNQLEESLKQDYAIDIVIRVERGQDGKPEIQIDLKRGYAKAIYNSQNPILFVLAIALASGAIKDYETADGVFNLEVLGYNHYISVWVDHMLRVPIFRWPIYVGPTRANPKSSLLSRQLTNEAQRRCYNKLTAIDCRREELMTSNEFAITCEFENLDSHLGGEAPEQPEQRVASNAMTSSGLMSFGFCQVFSSCGKPSYFIRLAKDISGVVTVASVLLLFLPVMLVGLAEDFSGVTNVASDLPLFLPMMLVRVPVISALDHLYTGRYS
ncbi:hypothetical protein G7Y89_g5287 [Cudoniella acicularis]|uniref:Uncharacterized protein n=1 Tax=Cudoniella acicularis TaxID=354080 RepID=A0A8H4RMR5_9HELO|nr:hypothetical protein G7Y89_g5287 [Cudoniella acicularis]